MPITLVLLVVVFGSVVAALLPLAVGVLAIIGTSPCCSDDDVHRRLDLRAQPRRPPSGWAWPSTTACSSSPASGRSWAHGYDTATAVVRTVRTAGRTVISAPSRSPSRWRRCCVFPITFLKSFAYAGIAVAVIAAVGAVVVLPGAARRARAPGRQVGRCSTGRPRRPSARAFWHRIATAVMRGPLPIATAGDRRSCSPSARRSCTSPSACPTTGCCRRATRPAAVQDTLRNDFTSREASPLEVVLTGIDPSRSGGDRRVRRRPVAGAGRGPGRRRHRQLRRRRQVAPAGPALGPVRRRRRHLAVGRAVGRADVGRGRGRRPRRAGGARPGAGPRRRPVGRAGRLEGLAVLQHPAGRRRSSWSTTFVVLFLLFGSLLCR